MNALDHQSHIIAPTSNTANLLPEDHESNPQQAESGDDGAQPSRQALMPAGDLSPADLQEASDGEVPLAIPPAPSAESVRRRVRRPDEQRLADSEAETQRLKEKIARKKLAKDPAIKPMLVVLRAIDNAQAAIEDGATRQRLLDARSAVLDFLTNLGVTPRAKRGSGHHQEALSQAPLQEGAVQDHPDLAQVRGPVAEDLGVGESQQARAPESHAAKAM